MEFIKQRPWIWIVVLLGLVVVAESIFFYVASSTLGTELVPFPDQVQAQNTR